ITGIHADPADLTLVLASPSGAPSEQDHKALRRFVEEGGRVIATGAGGAAFLGGTTDPSRSRSADPAMYTAVLPSRRATGAPTIRIAPEAEDPRLDPAYVPIYGSDREAVVRAARIGRGLAIWWAGSTPLSNAAIGDAGH